MAKQNETKKNQGKKRNQGGCFGNPVNASRGSSSSTPSGPSASTQGTASPNPAPGPLDTSATTQGTPALNPSPKPLTLTRKEINVIEDKTIIKNQKLIPNKNPELHVLPPRLGYNSRGEKTTLITNCFQLHLADLPTLYRYHVEVKREEAKAPGAKLEHILYHFLNSNDAFREAIPLGNIASDFAATIVSTRRLEDSELTSIIEYRGQKSKYRTDRYSVNLHLTNTISSKHTVDFLKGFSHPLTKKAVDQHLEFIQALNILHRGKAKWKSFNIFAPPTRIIIGHKTYKIPSDDEQKEFKFGTGVIAIPGFVSSIRPAAGRFLSNIQGTTGLFYKAGELSQLMTDFFGTKPDAKNLKEFHDFVKGVKVRLTYRYEKDGQDKEVLAIKTIRGLAHKNDGTQSDPPQLDSKGDPIKELDPALEFTAGAAVLGAKCNQVKYFRHEGKKVTEGQPNGKMLSVDEHIKDKHGDKAKSDDSAINVGTRLRPEYVPMACCHVIAGQTYRATLTSTEVAKMITLTRKTPKQNTDMISKDAADVLAFGEQTTITIPDETLLTVAAWKLPSGIVLYGQQQVAKSHSGNMTNITTTKTIIKGGRQEVKEVTVVLKYTRPGELAPDQWRILVIPGKAVDKVKVDNTEKLIKEKLRDRGDGKNVDHLKTALEGRRLWFMFVPADFSLDEYKTLKQMADVQLGIHTCCMNMSKRTDNPQYCDNVLLKANLKCGGVNQTVKLPDTKVINFDTTMDVGLDVTHPAPGAQGEQSIAAMVASIDSQLGQWSATMAQQTYSKDEVKGIKNLLTPHLTRWMTKHSTRLLPKQLPKQILVYRDGVSEGQYRQVVEYEYKHMREVCKEVYEGQKKSPPKITIVIVGKRHHMRFFKRNDQLDIENPEPGTVVDREVTSQYLWEFYLQAHEPIQGTARPAHYVVVVDDIFSNMSPDLKSSEVLIQVTHMLSYTMGRATCAIGVCTPAFLADKACDRARFYGPEPKVHVDMEDKMFYI
ncbi:Piwi domain containing protein [Rhypophila decipiens]